MVLTLTFIRALRLQLLNIEAIVLTLHDHVSITLDDETSEPTIVRLVEEEYNPPPFPFAVLLYTCQHFIFKQLDR